MDEPEREGDDDWFDVIEDAVDGDLRRDGGSFCPLYDQLSFGTGKGDLAITGILAFGLPFLGGLVLGLAGGLVGAARAAPA